MAQIIRNSKPIEQIADFVQLWDLRTNAFSKMERARYNKLIVQNKPTAIGSAPPDFFRRFYIVEDFPGQKLEMYHAVSMDKIECLTLSLFQEIQKRNPVENRPVYENGVKIKNTWSAWERYLISRDEIEQAARQPERQPGHDIAAMVQAAVQQQLKAIGISVPKNEIAQSIKDVEINDTKEDNETKEEAQGEINDKPKKGRRKKAEA